MVEHWLLLLRYTGVVTVLVARSQLEGDRGLRTAGAWPAEELFARSGMVAEAREPRKRPQREPTSCNGGAMRDQLQHGISAT